MSDPTSSAPDDGAPMTDSDPAGEIDALRAELETVRAQAEQHRQEHLRALADIENTRRRLQRDAQTSLKFAAEGVLGELLAVCDSLELGLKAASGAEASLQAMAEGMQLTHRQLIGVLEKHGVNTVDPAGQPFNPELHQAMTMVETEETAPNHVHGVLQKGYTLHERLLRPAMVTVARAPQSGG